MRIYIAALGLALAVMPAVAQKKSPSAPETAMLERGKTFRGSGAQYAHLPQVLAVERRSPSETAQQAVARIGKSGAEVVETKGNLVLFRSAQAQPAAVAGAGEASLYPTVVNARTGTLGVLTGTLIVRPKSLADADAIARDHGLLKAKVYPQVQTVFYRAAAGVDIADVAASLQADPRVEIAYPEIIEQVRVPK